MHRLIVGNSGSGKSNLAKYMAHQAKGSVVVLDPTKSRGWPSEAKKFSSHSRFLNWVKKAENCYVFVDEAKTLWDFDVKEADQLLYKRRHQGILTTLIAQRATMIRPNARNQCSTVYAFKQQKMDAETLSADYNDALIACNSAGKNRFFFSNSFSMMEYELDYSRCNGQFPENSLVPPTPKKVVDNVDGM